MKRIKEQEVKSRRKGGQNFFSGLSGNFFPGSWCGGGFSGWGEGESECEVRGCVLFLDLSLTSHFCDDRGPSM